MTIKQQCSIVIITLNEERNIANLLDDLCRQSHKDFEVIVVDSASTDTTVETAQKFADRLDLKTIVMDGRGTSLGRNTGAENARYERLLFLDAPWYRHFRLGHVVNSVFLSYLHRRLYFQYENCSSYYRWIRSLYSTL